MARIIIGLVVVVALMATTSFVVWSASDAASIGGTFVPDALRCAEDEVIAFVGVDTLDCVHIDTFK